MLHRMPERCSAEHRGNHCVIRSVGCRGSANQETHRVFVCKGPRFIHSVILNRRACKKADCANLEPFWNLFDEEIRRRLISLGYIDD